MKALAVFMVCAVLLSACASPKQVVVVNEFLRCDTSAAIQQKMLRLINQARSAGRSCGTKNYRAAGPVRWNPRLAKAAVRHSSDMAQNNFFSHTGSSGGVVSKRVEAAGYAWQAVGENIAAGRQTCEEVVSGWLQSSGHCANIMQPVFTEIGAACSQESNTRYGTYWTLVLAKPRK